MQRFASGRHLPAFSLEVTVHLLGEFDDHTHCILVLLLRAVDVHLRRQRVSGPAHGKTLHLVALFLHEPLALMTCWQPLLSEQLSNTQQGLTDLCYSSAISEEQPLTVLAPCLEDDCPKVSSGNLSPLSVTECRGFRSFRAFVSKPERNDRHISTAIEDHFLHLTALWGPDSAHLLVDTFLVLVHLMDDCADALI